jgi:hypothetical protein
VEGDGDVRDVPQAIGHLCERRDLGAESSATAWKEETMLVRGRAGTEEPSS